MKRKQTPKATCTSGKQKEIVRLNQPIFESIDQPIFKQLESQVVIGIAEAMTEEGHISVVEMAWIVDIVETVGMGMVVDSVVGIVIGIVEDTFVDVAGFHNHIPSNLVQIGFDIVVEAKLVMALGYSKSFEEDTDSFVEGIAEGFVEESLVAKAFLVPYNRNLLFLVLIPLDLFAILSTLDSFLLNDFMCKNHILEHSLKDILLMHVFSYIWDKRLLGLFLVLLSFYFLL